VPEFNMSRTESGFSGELPKPSIIRQFSCCFIFAPSFSQAITAALVSSEKRGLISFDFPFARDAMITALMVWDFEEGIVISPESCSVFWTPGQSWGWQ